MNAQEIFNKVANHLLTQKEQAVLCTERMTPTCVYLDSTTGRRCAIGCLMPDNHQGLNFMGGVQKLIDRYPDLRRIFPEALDRLIESLQEIHDTPNKTITLNKLSESVRRGELVDFDVVEDRLTYWKEELIELGKEWELDLSVIPGS